MGIIFNFLKSASPGKEKSLQEPKALAFFISAALLTIPLPNNVNSIAVIGLVLYCLLFLKKQASGFSFSLLLPVLLYLLMAVSYLWSANPPETSKALIKELPLLILPVVLFLVRPSAETRGSVLRNYSYGMAAFGAFYVLRALLRYLNGGGSDVFFYHELVTKDVNAIYISAMMAVALFYFLAKKGKTLLHYALMVFLLVLIILLSSKNIIITTGLLIVGYYSFMAPFSFRKKAVVVVFLLAAIAGIGYFSKIRDRIVSEYIPAESTAPRSHEGINNISVYEAFTLPRFQGNDYFNGTAFRAYQLRIFKEMLQEDSILFTGYGLNASLEKIRAKGVEYNVYQGRDGEEGYHMLNFHNQYIEIFADLGLIGFLIFIFIQVYNLKNGVSRKDFIHIAFAILMISLFLTESFLWRQRGVVFFTLLYCLFNTNLSGGFSKRNI